MTLDSHLVCRATIQSIPTRNLRYRYTRRLRLKTNRPLLFVRPKSIRAFLNHQFLPRSVHYHQWTLSTHTLSRQSANTGRIPSDKPSQPENAQVSNAHQSFWHTSHHSDGRISCSRASTGGKTEANEPCDTILPPTGIYPLFVALQRTFVGTNPTLIHAQVLNLGDKGFERSKTSRSSS